MRILLYSNAPWSNTGYGTQVNQLALNLQRDGHEVAIAANYGLMGATMNWNGIPVFPGGYDQYSNDLAPGHAKFWLKDNKGWVLTLYDVWVLNPDAWSDIPVAGWVPIDHLPPPDPVAIWCQRHPTVAMSKWAQAELEKVGAHPGYIPHSLDLQRYRPTPLFRGTLETRPILNVPSDAFLVTVVAANRGILPSRKSFPELLSAMGIFMKRHADVRLYMHTEANAAIGNPPMGLDLRRLMKTADIAPERVSWADYYAYRTGMITAEDMAAIYTTSDVLLAPSRGEGFGIPVIEAQACGTPVIVNNFSAQPELVGGGWIVEGQEEIDPIQGTIYKAPSVESIVEALESAYAAKGDETLRGKALAKAAEYDDARVYPEMWRPFIASLEQKLASQPKAGGNRSQRRLAKKAKRAA